VKRYFVTGTDTGVGKTYVACGLARRAREKNPRLKVFGFKPLETGTSGATGEDQRVLVKAAGDWQEGPLRGLPPFAMPAAPYVAALAEGQRVSIDEVLRLCDSGTQQAELSVIEGAGGWRVPITEDVDMAGLAQQLGSPVVIVARAGLGTINHSLLTIEAVEHDGCRVAALVISKRPEEDEDFTNSNAHEIARRWKGRVLVLGSDLSTLDPLL
jgi:dethiobiotin synthetase